jgi:serine/threonine protein kinase
MASRIIMSQEIKQYLASTDNTGEYVVISGKHYRLIEPISTEGFKSIVWKGIDEYGIHVAIKFATHEDYIERSFLDEINRANILYEYEQFAKYFGGETKEFDSGQIKCIVFVEQWIEGLSLSKFLDVTPSFIYSYVQQMCEILNILKENNLRHDDLHSNNILITKPPKGTLNGDLKLKIIDMGSLKAYTEPLKPTKNGIDDLKHFCIQLAELSNRLLYSGGKRKILSREAKFIREEIKNTLLLILEDDVTRALSDPKNIIDQFESAYLRSLRQSSDVETLLRDPFDYISAEHIGSDKLLTELFAVSCPWLNEVTSHIPILLTGPRGCGKSMIFRWLSLKSVILRDEKQIRDAQISGFYVSCSAELRNRFSLFTNETQTKQAKEEIIHYFNLLLSKEIVFTLLQISKRPDKIELFGLDDKVERDIYDYLIKQFNINGMRLYMQGVKPFEHMLEIILFEMNYCYQYILKRERIQDPTPLTFLADFTHFLKDKVEYLKKRTITFLLDDYSIHRLSIPVQKTLNPILWDRRASHIFKVSSEKYGMVHIIDDTSESFSTSDLSREYLEVDVGLRYVSFGDAGRVAELIKFSSDLLNLRLRLAGYSGTADLLIGNSFYEEGNLALALRSKPSHKKNDKYHGLDTISKICSGDISALLEIYRKIFKDGNVAMNSTNRVSNNVQNDAIVSVSRTFLEMIKTYQPFGPEMYDLVINFGNLCSRILVEGKPQKGEVPNETTRIEVEQLENTEIWSPQQESFILELIRRSVFISLEPGRGRHTLGNTLRLQLRRIYCPQLKTGLMKNVAIKWSDSEFKFFLTSPKSMCELEFKNRWKIGNVNKTLFDKP